MQIEINGKRNITLDFNAPKKFRLVKDGAEIPYIRTGKNSFRLSKPVDGFVELEEIVEQPRYMQPVQLQPQQMTVINPQDVDRLNEAVRQMALVNPQDVMIINQTAEQLEQNQNFIAQTQKEITDNQVYIDQQQQRLNETALGIQALETDNSQRLDGAENAILNLAGEISNTQNMAVDGMNTALNKIEEQGILLQAEIDKKADKDELESLKKDFEEKSDRISSAMANYSGGTAYDTLPQGGEAGQILAKRTDRQGDYIWIDQTPVIVKSETIPTASEKYKDEVYQYVGETGDYTHGYIYECQQNGTSYNWVRLDVQPNTAVWGQITGTLSDQTDLQNALNAKYDASNPSGYQANVIETVKVNGTALTPSSKAVDITVPAAQVNSDWNASSGIAEILNKPSLATVATSGSYNDLSNTPTIPTVDQTYSASSTNAQSGTAVASAISGKANNSDVVKLTGNQTVAGTKTFTSTPTIKMNQPNLYMQYTGISKGTAPASTLDGWFGTVYDKNGTAQANKMAQIYHEYSSSGASSLNLSIFEPTANSTTAAILKIGYYSNKKIFTSAPTPDTSDNSTQIATTAFVKAQGYIGSENLATCHVVVETYVNGTSWYRVYDDGWIEQGGVITNATYSGVTVSLLKSFSDTNYIGFVTAKRTSNDGQGDVNPQFDIINNTQAKIGCGVHGGSTCQWVAFGY